MTFPRGLSPGGSIALGIVVGVLSTSVQSLGLTLQRKSHILEDGKAPHLARRPPHRRRRWQLGMALFLAANLLGSSVQISTLPLPVLSTLQASGLVFNSLCATLILGEPFTRWSLWGTLLVCSGAVLIAAFGAIPEPAHNLAELLALLVRPAFVAWMAVQAVLVVALATAVELAGVLAPPHLAQASRFRLGRGLAYGAISGILSAHALLVAKSAVELLVRTVADGSNQFGHWQAWALVLVFATLALVQLYYLHRGLRLVTTSVLYPLVFCVYNIIAILDGLIYFRQTDLISPLRACIISLGTAILLSGVLALSWRLTDDQLPPPAPQTPQAPGCDPDDTDEETLLLGSSDTLAIITPDGDHDNADGDEHQSLLPKKYVTSYHTFACATRDDAAATAAGAQDSALNVPPSPVSGRRITAASLLSFSPTTMTSPRWAEQAEIWGELEDQASSPRSGGGTSSSRAALLRRHRSKTLPDFLDWSPALAEAAAASAAAAGTSIPDDDIEALAAYRRASRRRRKTMGLHARRPSIASTGGLRDALGGMWRFSWWAARGRRSVSTGPMAPPTGSEDPN